MLGLGLGLGYTFHIWILLLSSVTLRIKDTFNTFMYNTDSNRGVHCTTFKNMTWLEVAHLNTGQVEVSTSWSMQVTGRSVQVQEGWYGHREEEL